MEGGSNTSNDNDAGQHQGDGMENNPSNNLVSGATDNTSRVGSLSTSDNNNPGLYETITQNQITVVYFDVEDGTHELFGFNTEGESEDWNIAVRGINIISKWIYAECEKMQLEGNTHWYAIACSRYRRWLEEIHVLIYTFGRSHVPKQIKDGMREIEEQLEMPVTFPENDP